MSIDLDAKNAPISTRAAYDINEPSTCSSYVAFAFELVVTIFMYCLTELQRAPKREVSPNHMNLNKLMKQAQKMQEQMAKTQAEHEQRTVEVSAGGGKVKVTANGAGDVIAIKIDKEVIDPNDVEFLEEMVLSAVKQGIEQGKALAHSEMSRITGGLGIPGLQ